MSWVRRSLSDSSTSQNKAEATEQTKHQQNQQQTIDMHLKHMLAQKEAQFWKKKYYALAAQKVKQLGSIELHLMILESRLQTEKRDLEERFQKQQKLIEEQKQRIEDQEQKIEQEKVKSKEQKQKIETMTTTNHKLLSVLMNMSQNHREESKLYQQEFSQATIEITSEAAAENELLPAKSPVLEIEEKKNKLKDKKRRTSSRGKHNRASRSKSLPLNAFQVLSSLTSTATPC